MENYDILTNGFFFLSYSLLCRFRLSHQQQSSLFLFLRLLFVPFEEAHIAPWRRLLLRPFSVVLCFHRFENSNGFFFQLPKKKSIEKAAPREEKKSKKNLFLARWARSWLLWNTIIGLVRVGDSRCGTLFIFSHSGALLVLLNTF